MGVGRRKEFENLSKKAVFFVSGGKNKLHYFVPLEKLLEKSTSSPLGKKLPTPMHPST